MEITLLSLLGKSYTNVLEKRIDPIVGAQTQEEQRVFHPRCGTLEQLSTLH